MRGVAHRLQILGKALPDAGPDHLNGDELVAFGPAQDRLVNLRDGSRRHRSAESGEDLANRVAERVLDEADSLRLRKRSHPVLQALEVPGGFDADDVRPR